MWKGQFGQLAAYNRWANRRLYEEAGRLPDAERKRDLGLFFHSLHGTLNHLLVADRVWLRRLTGTGPEPQRLNEILFDDFEALRAARETEDARIIGFIDGLTEDEIEKPFEYSTLSGKHHSQVRRDTLTHFFNHQTHHRGQAHAALTILGVAEPASLDLLAMQRSG
jgi:uncharacterized damage-inducible protein DinB